MKLRGTVNTESAYLVGGKTKQNPGEITEGSHVKHSGQTGCRPHIKKNGCCSALTTCGKKKNQWHCLIVSKNYTEQTIWKE